MNKCGSCVPTRRLDIYSKGEFNVNICGDDGGGSGHLLVLVFGDALQVVFVFLLWRTEDVAARTFLLALLFTAHLSERS